eukprot:2476847-Amphidinium_carterae.1
MCELTPSSLCLGTKVAPEPPPKQFQDRAIRTAQQRENVFKSLSIPRHVLLSPSSVVQRKTRAVLVQFHGNWGWGESIFGGRFQSLARTAWHIVCSDVQLALYRKGTLGSRGGGRLLNH